jgi:hypothetical protein
MFFSHRAPSKGRPVSAGKRILEGGEMFSFFLTSSTLKRPIHHRWQMFLDGRDVLFFFTSSALQGSISSAGRGYEYEDEYDKETNTVYAPSDGEFTRPSKLTAVSPELT